MNEKRCERREKQIYSLSSKSTAWRDPTIEKEFIREAMATRHSLGDGTGSLGRKPWGVREARSAGLETELTKTVPSKAAAPCLLLPVLSA